MLELLCVKHLFNITLIPLNILFCEIINEMSWDVKFGLQNREIGGGGGGSQNRGSDLSDPLFLGFWDEKFKPQTAK